MKTICYNSLKGGTSKTTLTLNTAGRKALKHKVLVLDMDEQKNATSILRTDQNDITIYDVLIGKSNIKDSIKQSRFKNIFYISGSQKITNISIDKLAIKKLLQEVYSDFDYVIIDTPPSINTIVQSTYIASDIVMIPTILDKFSSANLMNVINEVMKLNRKATIKVVPSMMVSNSKLHKNVYDELKQFIDSKEGIEITEPLPNSIEVSNQMMNNKLLINSNKWNKLKYAMKKFIDEV